MHILQKTYFGFCSQNQLNYIEIFFFSLSFANKCICSNFQHVKFEKCNLQIIYELSWPMRNVVFFSLSYCCCYSFEKKKKNKTKNAFSLTKTVWCSFDFKRLQLCDRAWILFSVWIEKNRYKESVRHTQVFYFVCFFFYFFYYYSHLDLWAQIRIYYAHTLQLLFMFMNWMCFFLFYFACDERLVRVRYIYMHLQPKIKWLKITHCPKFIFLLLLLSFSCFFFFHVILCLYLWFSNSFFHSFRAILIVILCMRIAYVFQHI